MKTRLLAFLDRPRAKYGAVIGALFFSLCPSLFFSFGYHNDFNAWAYDSSKCCTHHPETRILDSIGRYFGAIAQNFQFLTIHSLHDLWIWRLIGIVAATLMAAFYLRIISLARNPTWRNSLITIAVFTLPTMQFQAIWVSMFMFWTPPILLALLATKLILRSTPENGKLSENFKVYAAGFSALLAGIFFYPASVTFVLVPTAHLLMIEKSKRMRYFAIKTIVALGSAFVSLFLIHKFLVLPRLTNVPYLGEYEFKISSDFTSMLLYRLKLYYWNSVHLWIGTEGGWFPNLIENLLLLGIAGLIFRIATKKVKLSSLSNFFLAAALFFVAIAPLAVVSQFTLTQRITFAMTGIVMLCFFELITLVLPKPTIVAFLFAVTGMGNAFATVFGVSELATKEQAIFANSLGHIPPAQIRAVAVLRPNVPRRLGDRSLRQDFGSLFPIDEIVDQTIGTRYNGKTDFAITTIHLKPVEEAPPYLESDAIVIDASAAYGIPNFKNIGLSGKVSARPRSATSSMNAVDRRADTFWEVCKQPFPMELELTLPAARRLVAYTMSTIEDTDRMPINWELLVTSDLQTWRVADRVTRADPWKIREVRKYELPSPTEVRGIKLVIHSSDLENCMRLYEFIPTYADL